MIRTILLLIFEFMKTGLMAVGGGMACIRFLQDMIAKYGWITGEELANIIAVAESSPGPIGVNAATYVGYSVLEVDDFVADGLGWRNGAGCRRSGWRDGLRRRRSRRCNGRGRWFRDWSGLRSRNGLRGFGGGGLVRDPLLPGT